MQSLSLNYWPLSDLPYANVAALVFLVIIAGLCLYRLSATWQFTGLSPARDDLVGLVMLGLGSAWPIYWLVAYLLLFDANTGWSALITVLATVTFLPTLIAKMLDRKLSFGNANSVMLGFFVLTSLALLAMGVGIDRRFSRLDGHFLLTSFLLWFWWAWTDRSPASTNVLNPAHADQAVRPTSPFAATVCIAGYHLCIAGVLPASFALARSVEAPKGIVLGLVLAAIWTPATVKFLVASAAAISATVSRSLSIIYLGGAAVLVTNNVDFPITLWQMEVAFTVLVAVLYLGLSRTAQRLRPSELNLMVLLYLIYLTLRILRLRA